MTGRARREPSDAEWAVLHLLTERGAGTARELHEALAPRRGWSRSTVKTLLARLVEKGFVRARRKGAAYVYAPDRSARRALFHAADELLHRAREDAVGPLLAHLVQRSRLSREELDELKRLIEDQERRRGR